MKAIFIDFLNPGLLAAIALRNPILLRKTDHCIYSPNFFPAVQNKPIPMIPWNDDLDEALANPYFQLLQQNLGLYTNDDPNIVYPRIPQYLTPTLLVNKARQIGSIDSGRLLMSN